MTRFFNAYLFFPLSSILDSSFEIFSQPVVTLVSEKGEVSAS